jgi:hypothetical protein
MARDTERTAVFLHQVKIGDVFYCTPSDVRAWIRACPADETRPRSVEVPVQRGGLRTHMNGMAHVWVRPVDGTDR